MSLRLIVIALSRNCKEVEAWQTRVRANWRWNSSRNSARAQANSRARQGWKAKAGSAPSAMWSGASWARLKANSRAKVNSKASSRAQVNWKASSKARASSRVRQVLKAKAGSGPSATWSEAGSESRNSGRIRGRARNRAVLWEDRKFPEKGGSDPQESRQGCCAPRGWGYLRPRRRCARQGGRVRLGRGRAGG